MSDDNQIETQTSNKMAFVLGHTGECGKALVKELSKRKLFKKIVLLGRREVKLDTDLGPEIEQKVIDFDNLSDHKDSFKDLDTGFCCLGTTSKVGKANFIKVDHDYVINSAEVAKSVGCKHFLLVSSYGAKKNSFFLYPKTKGQVEEELQSIGFDNLTIFRPGLLLCDRVERRPVENCIRWCTKHLPNSFIKQSAITTDNLAKAMIYKAENPSEEKVEITENRFMYDLF